MEIRIGITNTGRELSFETSESADAVTKAVQNALDAKIAHLTFTDDKGKAYIVPVANLAYVEVGSDHTRKVGFVG